MVLLVNPVAGGGAGGRAARRCVPLLAGLGFEVLLVAPPDPDAVEAEVREAASRGAGPADLPRALVAVGGDGTVRVAAGIAVRVGLPLGIIPAGTGNGVAYSLGLPLDTGDACRVLAQGTVRPCDVGRIEFLDTGQATLFVNVAGAGLDAAISRSYSEKEPGVRGVPGYTLAAVRSLLNYGPFPLDLELDGRPLQLDALLVAVGNGGFYGKGIRIVPPARVADGLLDLCVVLPVGLSDLTTLVPMLLVGRQANHPKVRLYRAREIVLRSRQGGTRSVPVHADGDVVGSLPVRVTVIPRAIRVFLDTASAARL